MCPHLSPKTCREPSGQPPASPWCSGHPRSPGFVPSETSWWPWGHGSEGACWGAPQQPPQHRAASRALQGRGQALSPGVTSWGGTGTPGPGGGVGGDPGHPSHTHSPAKGCTYRFIGSFFFFFSVFHNSDTKSRLLFCFVLFVFFFFFFQNRRQFGGFHSFFNRPQTLPARPRPPPSFSVNHNARQGGGGRFFFFLIFSFFPTFFFLFPFLIR